MKYSFQHCHNALLVSLQTFLTWIERHSVFQYAVDIVVLVCLARILIEVGMFVPVHVERDIVFLLLVGEELSSHCCRSVAVEQVVGIDVA